MLILSHRGSWLHSQDKNTLNAITRSVAEGFGAETDVRDHLGRLVVSHDPPGDGPTLTWSTVVSIFEGTSLPLAVNIKADGLVPLLLSAFTGSRIDWFAFDMSGPETVRYAEAGIPFFTRQSDVEALPLLYKDAAGVWLDSFGPTWFGVETIKDHIDAGKRVCVVSPELHGREPHQTWAMLAEIDDNGTDLMLCTDFPSAAQKFFK